MKRELLKKEDGKFSLIIADVRREIVERRYTSFKLARKIWRCFGCNQKIMPGDKYEFSYSRNLEETIRLCSTCSKENPK
jgi:uncharacterized protein with PIN domain